HLARGLHQVPASGPAGAPRHGAAMFNPGFLLAADFHCDSGYLLYGNFCYFFKIEDVKNWANAEAECVKEQGHLASFHSEEEFSFLIGGFDSHVDGTPLSHTNWADGEPNNHEGREECVEMIKSGHTLDLPSFKASRAATE
uniref:C-type lectin domain-containing protein n=1 Tax=Salarias fasciatus TaxID=181472 RepID=A0A672FS74_SALFA